MQAESIFHEVRQALGGRPGQAIVLGVCQALAVRFGRQVWHVRLATLILGLLWTLPVLAAYIILGFVLPETERRSRDFFTGAGIMARENAERIFAALGGLFGASNNPATRGKGY